MASVRSTVTVLPDALRDRAEYTLQTNPFNTRLPAPLPACRWGEAALGLGAALALHLIGLAVAPTSAQSPPMTPPAPIRVQWIAAPQTRADNPKPAPQIVQQTPQPELHLRADQAVPYRFIAEALADASKAGVTRIGFVSEPDKVDTR